jgi:hypothetical protein
VIIIENTNDSVSWLTGEAVKNLQQIGETNALNQVDQKISEIKTEKQQIKQLADLQKEKEMAQNNEKKSDQLEKTFKKIVSTAKDDGSGMYGGPDTETFLKLIGGPSLVLYENIIIRRGTTLQSLGIFGEIPQGTEIFPIKFIGECNGLQITLTSLVSG